MKREHTNISSLTPLQYIESTGTQWIDTQDFVRGTDSVELDVTVQIDTGNLAPYGCSNGDAWNKGAFELFWYNDWLQLITASSNSSSQLTNWYDIWHSGAHLNITVNKTTWTINGQTASKATLYSSYIANQTLCIFGSKRIYSGVPRVICIAPMKLHWFKWFRNGNIYHDYYPYLNNGKPCLQDKTDNSFLYNAGTGEFLYG